METQKTVRELIKRLTGQANTLTIQRLFIDYTGDHISALLLSQILYWSERAGGWFYKKAADWETELGITKRQLNRAEEILDKKGVERQLKKVGTAPVQHYRIADNFTDLIMTFCESDKTSQSQKEIITKGDAGKSQNVTIQESDKTSQSSNEAEITKDYTKITSARTNGARRRNEYSDAFCTAYAILHPDELPYKPRKADFVQLADLQKTADIDAPGWFTLTRWQRAIDNYLASNVSKPTMAHLATDFRTYYKYRLDRFGKAVDCVAPKTESLPGCELCLNDPVRLKTKTEPGWRFDTVLKSLTPCVCNPVKGKTNGSLQRQGQQAASH